MRRFEDGNPVLFLEHKGLYRSAKGPVPDGYYTLPIGKAPGRPRRHGRHGRDLRRRRRRGPSRRRRRSSRRRVLRSRSIDLRTLLPWDVDDRRRVGAQDLEGARAPRGADDGRLRRRDRGDASRTSASAISTPPSRGLGGLDIPVPFSKALEEIYMPKARLVDALRRLVTS